VRISLPLCLVLLLSCLTGAAFAATTIAVGNLPQQIALNPVTNRIYVSNLNDNTVSVIDGATNTVVDTIAVGMVPEQIAVNTTTDTIYVANENSNTISVIDASTDIIVATMPSAATAFLAVNPVTNRIYADNELAQTVSVFDGSTNTLVTTIAIPGAETIPVGLVVNPSTNTVYLTVDSSEDNKNVTVINGATNAIITSIPMPNGAEMGYMAADFQLSRIYLTDINLKAVYVFNTTTNTVTNTLSLPASHNPFEVGVAPNHEVVVSDYTGGTLIRINPWSLTVDGTWGNGRGPSGIAINAITNTMYIVDTFSNVVTVIPL
jgi:YVTN family beta-propeller protein